MQLNKKQIFGCNKRDASQSLVGWWLPWDRRRVLSHARRNTLIKITFDHVAKSCHGDAVLRNTVCDVNNHTAQQRS